MYKQTAYFGMGCFWEPDDYFSKLDGVLKTEVGYAGGEKKNPTYHDLGDNTETIKIIFDSEKISFEDLLEHFFKKHDPTLDQKTQYRTVIFYNDEKQEKIARDKIKKIGIKNIKTSIEPIKNYTRAEEYHQKYLKKNNVKGVC